VLSGGERNRLLLAKLFANPANVLVLDEPTNDLDLETLELLEDRLVEYDGTILLVSHDRAFLDDVVTSTLVFEGDATVNEYVGGHADWLACRARQSAQTTATPPPEAATAPPTPPAAAPAQARRKRSWKETRELEALPAKIAALEAEQAEIQARMADPGHYKRPKDEIAAWQNRHGRLTAEIDAATARWLELEALPGD
jgi:ATP-binding cassette subfamily F protein uup